MVFSCKQYYIREFKGLRKKFTTLFCPKSKAEMHVCFIDKEIPECIVTSSIKNVVWVKKFNL